MNHKTPRQGAPMGARHRISSDRVWPLRAPCGRTFAERKDNTLPEREELLAALHIVRIGADNIPQPGARQHVIETIDAIVAKVKGQSND